MDYASPSPAPEGRQNVGGSARRGFLWLMFLTVFAKVVNSLATFVAAWFLLPQDYKLVALAFPITQFISVMQQMGVDKVLISRGNQFDRLCNPGFWMSSLAGVLSGLLIFAAAPLAAIALHQPALQPMLILLAIAAPLNGITTVHQAWLQYHFRFRLIALMGMAGVVIQGGLTILMAWRGYGPYSLIIPVMANGFFRFAVYWAVVRLPLRFNPEFSRWWGILQDSFGAFGSLFCQLVVAQGDFLLLGFLLPADSDLLGYFSFAFNLSTAVITSLVVNMATVLFPALSTIADDPPRQTQIFLRASRRVAVVGLPLCLLQGASAAPLLHAIYGHKWDIAIGPLQLLSVCMAIRVVCLANYALFSAQGRFRYQFVLSAIYAGLFLCAVAVGAQFRTAMAVAWAESLYFLLFDNLNLYLAIRYGGGRWRDIAKLYSTPLGAGLVSVGAGWLLTLQLAHWDVNGYLQVVALTLVSGAIYVPLIWLFDRASYNEIASHAVKLIPGRVAPPAEAAAPLRILHVLPFSGMGGGAPRAMLTLVSEQLKHRPTWVVSLADDDFAAEARKTGATVICVFHLPHPPHNRFTRWYRTVYAIWRAVRRHRIDLIHCHSAPGNRYCFPASRLAGVPLVSHQRDTYQHDHFHAWVARTDAIIAISQWVLKNLPEPLHAKVTVINDAVPIPDESRIIWPRDQGKMVVGMAGRCVPEKGLDLLVDAAAALANRREFSAEIWGFQAEAPHVGLPDLLRQKVQAAGLQSRFEFVGYRADIDTFYRKIDIVIVPSRVTEGLGLTAAEGQAWGKPVIVAGHGGLLEIVEHEQTGLQFTPHDAHSLAQQLERLLDDADLRLRLARAGRRSAVAHFSPAVHADLVDAVYRRVLGR